MRSINDEKRLSISSVVLLKIEHHFGRFLQIFSTSVNFLLKRRVEMKDLGEAEKNSDVENSVVGCDDLEEADVAGNGDPGGVKDFGAILVIIVWALLFC